MAQSTNKSITAVGDPDQSIYGWRSAKNKVFQEMQDDFENTVTINLEQNYRSSAKIVESACHVIMQGRLYLSFIFFYSIFKQQYIRC